MRCGVLQLTGVAKKCSMCSWPMVYGGQEITQEKDLCIAAIAVGIPVEVVAPFAVVATIAFNYMVIRTSMVVVINYGLVLW